MINNQQDTDNIHLYAKELMNKYLINKRENVDLNHYEVKAFVEYTNDMQDAYKKIEKNTIQERNVKYYMIPDIINNKKPNPIVTFQLFLNTTEVRS